MRELDKQSKQVAAQTFNSKNSSCENASELADKLANQMYGSIRECDTDENLGFKADSIKIVSKM